MQHTFTRDARESRWTLTNRFAKAPQDAGAAILTVPVNARPFLHVAKITNPVVRACARETAIGPAIATASVFTRV